MKYGKGMITMFVSHYGRLARLVSKDSSLAAALAGDPDIYDAYRFSGSDLPYEEWVARVVAEYKLRRLNEYI